MVAVRRHLLAVLAAHAVLAIRGVQFREKKPASGSAAEGLWEGGRTRSPWKGLRDLLWDARGMLSFSELKMETHEQMHMQTGAPLYPVDVNLDIEALDMSAGITMMFDKQGHSMRLDEGISPADGLAWGLYKDDIAASGWSELFMFTSGNPTITNDVKMFAAGFVEGILTCIRMSQYYHNNHKLLLIDEKDHHALMNIKGMLNNELGFVKFKAQLVDHIMSEEPAAPYWKHSRYLFFQLWGINDGYNFAAKHFNVHELSLIDLFLINTGGEIPELMEAYQPIAAADRLAAQSPGPMLLQQRRARRRRIRGGEYQRPKMPLDASDALRRKTLGRRSPKSLRLVRKEEQNKQLGTGWKLSMDHPNKTVDPLDDAHWEQRIASDGRCSAFVRVSSGDADLFVGHTTWDDYSEMTRVFKYYTFPLHGADVMANTVAMSSYPGCISSMDDFYMLDSGMVITETSIELLDPTLFDKLNDFPMKAHLPNFMHIMITNRLAKTANHWASLMDTVNTGTYNSEWMIVDYNNFVPGKPVPDNTLWVLETIPGLSHKEDMSHRLRGQGYWASYNRPFFQDVREAAGHDGAQKSHGALYSWADNPRATIFRGASGGVQSLFDMRGLMDRNMYPFAGVEPNEPGHEISARMDLSPTQPIPNGGIDAKITNRCLFKQMICQAISGPSHANQKVFSWIKDDGTPAFPEYPHVGQPDAWNFGWVQMTPGGPAGILDC